MIIPFPISCFVRISTVAVLDRCGLWPQDRHPFHAWMNPRAKIHQWSALKLFTDRAAAGEAVGVLCATHHNAVDEPPNIDMENLPGQIHGCLVMKRPPSQGILQERPLSSRSMPPAAVCPLLPPWYRKAL